MNQPELEESVNLPATVTEDEHYWKQQVEGFKESELNRKAFCKLSDLNYHRFQYWYRKFERLNNPKPSVGVVPIKLKTDNKAHLSSALCSVQLATGATLYLHDMALVESLMKGAL
jgi:hypothetical protein